MKEGEPVISINTIILTDAQVETVCEAIKQFQLYLNGKSHMPESPQEEKIRKLHQLQVSNIKAIIKEYAWTRNLNTLIK